MHNLKKIAYNAAACAILGLFAANMALADDTTVTITDPLGGKRLEDIIQGITNFIFGLALLVCPIFIIWGGFEMVLANGEEKKITEGRQKIVYSLVGLVIIALSSTFVAVVKNILGVSH